MTNMKSQLLAAVATMALGAGAALANEGHDADARPYQQAAALTQDANQYRAAVHTHEMDIEAAGATNFYNTGAEARDGGNR